jgi:hypothetical protein
VNILLSKLSTITNPAEVITEWKQEASNQLQDVVDVLINFTKMANSIKEVGAVLGLGDMTTFFGNQTRSLLNAGFG